METDEDEEEEEVTSQQDVTDFDEDSTIVSSTRSLNSYDPDYYEYGHEDADDSTESTVNVEGIPLEFQKSANVMMIDHSSENSFTELSAPHHFFVHQNSIKIMNHSTLSTLEDSFTTSEHPHHEGLGPEEQDDEHSPKSTAIKFNTTKSPMSLPHFRAQQRRKLLQQSAAPTSQYASKDIKSRRFAKARRMSLGEMETVIDTVFRSVKSLTNGSQRRLSFGYAAEKEYDKAAPACEIARGCLTRMDTWAKRREEAQQKEQQQGLQSQEESDGDPAEDETSPSKKAKRVKSILKFFPKYSRSLQRRPSFFNKKDSSDIQKEAPKRPGRRTSFTGGNDTEDSAPETDQAKTAITVTAATKTTTTTTTTTSTPKRSMFNRTKSADRQLLTQLRRRFQRTKSAELAATCS
eukprot:scaffold25842_cov198-Amphora_coffeaeformis.AAC.1